MNTAILNIERNAPVFPDERTMTVIEPQNVKARKIRVAAYARVSSDSADQQNSYISQVRHYTQVIRGNEEWEFAGIYADEGLTGLDAAKRPDFQRMKADCRKGKIQRILVKSVSRFARNFHDCILTIRELKLMGVSVLFEKEQIDTAKMSDELELAIQSLWAQRESVSHAGNLRRGIRMKMKTGDFMPSNAPYGYRINEETRMLEIEQKQAEVVRRIFGQYLSGRGIQDISDSLNGEGIPRQLGNGRWHHTTILYVLTNISYTGDMIWQKTYTSDTIPFRKVINRGEKPQYYVQNDHPAIVSHEDFEKVRELMARRREKHAGTASGDYILGRSVECGHCGCLHGRKVVKDKVYWVCRQHNYSKSRCPIPQIPEPELYAAFIRMYNKLRLRRREIIAPMIEQFRMLADRRYRQNDRIKQVNDELNALSEQVLVLNRLKAKGYMEPALYFSKMQEVHERIRELHSLKAGLMEQADAESQAAVESLYTILENGTEAIDSMDGELFREMVEKIIVISAVQVKFRLYCGLELTENVQRAVR